MKFVKAATLFATLLIALVSSQSLLAKKLNIIATTGMIGDMVQNIAGKDATVDSLMGPGVDPHLYKASATDVSKLTRADIIFYNGLHLEGRMADLLERMGKRGKSVHAITDNLDRAKLLKPEEFDGHHDPHVWFDPALWSQCATIVTEALTQADPANAAAYRQRGLEFKNACAALAKWAKHYIAQIPEDQRYLITSHDAYNYFGNAFGFKVIGVQGISTVSEAGLADVVQITEFIKEKQIKAIFVESSVSPAMIQRVSSGSGAKIGGELFSDAMGLPGQIETAADGTTYDVGTYQGMLKHNVTTIVDALK